MNDSTNLKTINIKNLKEVYQSINSFDPHLGMNFDIHEPGNISYYLNIKKEHMSSPDAAHGGVLAAFMDATLGMSALSLAVTQNKLCATVEFKINYLGPVSLGDSLIGRGSIDFQGKSLIVSSAEIKKENGDLVAKGLGTFNLYPVNKKVFFNLRKIKNES